MTNGINGSVVSTHVNFATSSAVWKVIYISDKELRNSGDPRLFTG